MKDFDFSKFKMGIHNTLICNSACSISTDENQLLALRNKTIVDIGTLPQAAWLSHQYLNLGDGDLVLLNDPYSGNSHLHSMTIVVGFKSPLKVGRGQKSNSTNYLLSHRFWFKPRVFLTESIEEEGVRIPPTPLYHQGQFNQQLLDGVAAHPLCPPGFAERVQSEAKKVQSNVQSLGPVFEHFDLSDANLRAYLRSSKKRFQSLLEQFQSREIQLEHQFTDDTMLKLRIAVTSGCITFDFSGTESSNSIALTDGATLSACLHSLLQILPEETPINSGLLQGINVITPTNSTVSAKYPKPVFLGFTEGVQWLSHFVHHGLSQLNPEQPLSAESSTTQGSFEIQFQSGSVFFENILSGLGATQESPGISGHTWENRLDLNPCIEKVEKMYPIRYQSISIRERSGGQGLFGGGDGIAKYIEILQPSILKWRSFEPSVRPQGADGGQAGAAFEFYLVRGEQKIPLLENSEFKLGVGDKIALLSSGGGGYGKPSSS